MSEIAERFRAVAGTFTARVEGADDWDAPAPCEGWVARDVVRHLVEWVPGVFGPHIGLDPATVPGVDDDPAAAWATVRDALQRTLEDPAAEEQVMDIPPLGEHTLAVAIDRFVLGDVLVHTWDLARATGQDETIDEGEAARMYQGMAPMADLLAQSGQFAPAVDVADDASAQDKLIALTGRTP